MKLCERTSEEITTKDDCVAMNKNVDSSTRNETEKNIVDDMSHNDHEDVSKVSPAGLETTSEGESSSRKSDSSSDSSSWIRVLDKEGIFIYCK